MQPLFNVRPLHLLVATSIYLLVASCCAAQAQGIIFLGPHEGLISPGFDGLLSPPSFPERGGIGVQINTPDDVIAHRFATDFMYAVLPAAHPIQQATINQLANCSQLRQILLAGDVSHLDLSPLAQLPHLDRLGVYRAVNNRNLADISKLHSLRELELYEVVADNFATIKPLPMLSKVMLRGKLTEKMVLAVAALGATVDLDASQCDISDRQGLAALALIPNLRSLDINGCAIERETVEAVTECRRLEKLIIAPAAFEVLQPLGAMVNLKELRVPTEARGSEYVCLDFFRGMKSLEYLSLSAELDAEQLGPLFGLKHLRVLSFCPRSDSVIAALDNLPALRALRVFGRNLHGTTLGVLSQIPITHLSLDGCPLTSEALTQLTKIQSLQAIDLSDTSLTDDDLTQLINLPKLSRLELFNLHCATAYGVTLVAAAKPNCRIDTNVHGLAEGLAFDNELGMRTGLVQHLATHVAALPQSVYAARKEEEFRQRIATLREQAKFAAALDVEVQLAKFYLDSDRPADCEKVCRQILYELPLAKCHLLRAEPFDLGDFVGRRDMRRDRLLNVEIITRIQLVESLERLGRCEKCAEVLPALSMRACCSDAQTLLSKAQYDAVAAVVQHQANASALINRLFVLSDFPNAVGSTARSAVQREAVALAYLCIGNIQRTVRYEQKALDCLPTGGYQQQWFRNQWIAHSLLGNVLRDAGQSQQAEELCMMRSAGASFYYMAPAIAERFYGAYATLQTRSGHLLKAEELRQKAAKIRSRSQSP